MAETAQKYLYWQGTLKLDILYIGYRQNVKYIVMIWNRRRSLLEPRIFRVLIGKVSREQRLDALFDRGMRGEELIHELPRLRAEGIGDEEVRGRVIRAFHGRRCRADLLER
ncbi:MAG: hypothetical protein QOE22_96 [Candidatus Parcubacteria bacterium]|nr:hypothetical protein [Candidatus Parcubacteria bacterium]